MCKTRVLTQKGQTVISHCPECHMLNIWHQNLLLCFTPEQFRSFKNVAIEMAFEERAYPFPDGEERLILCTPHHDINFAFTTDEWEDFKECLEEAVYMQDIYEIINP